MGMCASVMVWNTWTCKHESISIILVFATLNVNCSEHFLFSFDLRQTLLGNQTRRLKEQWWKRISRPLSWIELYKCLMIEFFIHLTEYRSSLDFKAIKRKLNRLNWPGSRFSRDLSTYRSLVIQISFVCDYRDSSFTDFFNLKYMISQRLDGLKTLSIGDTVN